MIYRGLTLLPLLCVSLPLAAEGGLSTPAGAAGGEMPELFSVGYLAQVLGSLLVVFICLFAVIFFLRRVNRIGPGAAGPLQVIGSANLGHREKVVLLQAGDQQLLLGVAPGTVRTLHVLEDPIAIAENASQGVDFASVLRAANPLGGARRD